MNITDADLVPDRERTDEYRPEFLYGSDLGDQDLVDLFTLSVGQAHFWQCEGHGTPDLSESEKWASIARDSYQRLSRLVAF